MSLGWLEILVYPGNVGSSGLGLAFRDGSFPKSRVPFWGPLIGILVYWGLCRGPLVYRCHIHTYIQLGIRVWVQGVYGNDQGYT